MSIKFELVAIPAKLSLSFPPGPATSRLLGPPDLDFPIDMEADQTVPPPRSRSLEASPSPPKDFNPTLPFANTDTAKSDSAVRDARLAARTDTTQSESALKDTRLAARADTTKSDSALNSGRPRGDTEEAEKEGKEKPKTKAKKMWLTRPVGGRR
jgi:hypothetical protein